MFLSLSVACSGFYRSLFFPFSSDWNFCHPFSTFVSLFIPLFVTHFLNFSQLIVYNTLNIRVQWRFEFQVMQSKLILSKNLPFCNWTIFITILCWLKIPKSTKLKIRAHLRLEFQVVHLQCTLVKTKVCLRPEF